MERLVKFEVLGQEYPLYTDAPEEEVQEILRLVKAQIEEAHANRSTNVLPPNKLAVLSSLNMAGKYVKLKKDFERYRQQIDASAEKLISKIEESYNR